ncbi:MAG: hypothetical protein ACLQBY_10630 [Solirubrobacteraceae bacterium]
MRRVRIVLGFVAVVCAFGALAATAFARAPRPKHFYGEFTASAVGKTFSKAEPGLTKGTGKLEELKLAQLTITCEKPLVTKGEVVSARSTEYFVEMSLKKSKCRAVRTEGHTVEEPKMKFGPPLDIEYHSAGFAGVGGGGEPGAEITKETSVSFKVAGGICVVSIPPQLVPAKAEKKPEPTEPYSAAEFSRTSEEVEGGKKKKELFPANPLTGLLAGEQEYIEIEDVFTKIRTTEQVTEHCYEQGTSKKTEKEIQEEEERTKKPDVIEYGKGSLKAEFEEKLTGGDLGFTTEEA